MSRWPPSWWAEFGRRARNAPPPLALPTVMLVVGAVLLAAGVLMITRVAGFSWDRY